MQFSACDFLEWDWTAIGTIALAAVTTVTLLVQWYQFKQSRLDDNERAFKTSSITLITHLDKVFEDLTDERIKIANIINEKKVLDGEELDYNIFDKRLEDLYDFFDTLGYYVNESYIKAEVVHFYFYYWFSRYYEFYILYNVKKISGYNNNKAVWNNMASLLKKLNEIEITLLGKNKIKISKKDLKEFFLEEEKMGDE